MFRFSSGKLRSRARGRRGLITRGDIPGRRQRSIGTGWGPWCWGWVSLSAQDHPARPSGWSPCRACRQMENADPGSSKPASVVEHGTQFEPRTGDSSGTPAVSPAAPSSGFSYLRTSTVCDANTVHGRSPWGSGLSPRWRLGGGRRGGEGQSPIPRPPTQQPLVVAWWGAVPIATRQGEINLGRLIAYPNIVGNLHR